MDEETTQVIKTLLANPSFIGFVKKCGNIESLGTAIPKLEGIEIKDNTIGIMDKENIFMMVANTNFNAEAHATYSLARLKELLSVIPKDELDGCQFVVMKDKNMPCIIDLLGTICILAPTTSHYGEETKTETKTETAQIETEEVTEEFNCPICDEVYNDEDELDGCIKSHENDLAKKEMKK